MGQGSSGILSPAVIAQITEDCSFSEAEAKDLYRLFRQMSLLHGSSEHRLNQNSFIQIFASAYPGVDVEPFAKLIFKHYDTDQSGHIDFREFLTGLDDQLKPGLSEEALWGFKFLGGTEAGILTYENALYAIKAMYSLNSGYLPLESLIDGENYTQRLFLRAGRREQGTITLGIFKNVVGESQTARGLVQAIMKAASKPYWQSQLETGSIGRKRASTVIDTNAPPSSTNAAGRKSSVHQMGVRTFTV